MPKNNTNLEPEVQTQQDKPSIGEGLTKLADAATVLCKSSDIYADVPDDQKLEAADHASRNEFKKYLIICGTIIVCVGFHRAPAIIYALRTSKNSAA